MALKGDDFYRNYKEKTSQNVSYERFLLFGGFELT